MSGGNYPTLSSSIYTYAALLIHIDTLKKDSRAAVTNNSNLWKGLHACQLKLEKYLDQSTTESALYYFATCAYLNYISPIPWPIFHCHFQFLTLATSVYFSLKRRATKFFDLIGFMNATMNS